MKKLITTLCLVAAINLAHAAAPEEPSTSTPESTNELIANIIKTYGGEQAWLSVEGIEQSGRTFSNHRNSFGETQRSFMPPSQMNTTITYTPEDQEIRQLDGQHAWKDGQAAPDAFRQAAQLQASRLALPLLILQHREHIEDLGQRNSEQGTAHRGLMITLEPGLKVLLDIDVATHHILGSWGLLEMGGQRMEFATRYENFKEVDGRLFAFKENHFAMGNHTGYTELSKIKFTTHFAPNTYSPASNKVLQSAQL